VVTRNGLVFLSERGVVLDVSVKAIVWDRAARRLRSAALILCGALALASCRQDKILAEAAKFEDIQTTLHATTAAVADAPAKTCARSDALAERAQPLNRDSIKRRLARRGPDDCLASAAAFKTKLVASLGIIDDYGTALVRAAKGRAIPDPKLGELRDAFNSANPGGPILSAVKSDDINKIVGGIEALLDRNLRANQLRHIVREVDGPLSRVTDGLAPVFSDTAHCAFSRQAPTWCSLFDDEARQISRVWGAIADSVRANAEAATSGVNAPHPARFYFAQWDLRQRFEADVKAHDDAVQLGPAYALALRAFQKEHAAVRAVIDEQSSDSTAVFDR